MNVFVCSFKLSDDAAYAVHDALGLTIPSGMHYGVSDTFNDEDQHYLKEVGYFDTSEFVIVRIQ